MTRRPLANQPLLIADLQRHVDLWRQLHLQAIGALCEKALVCSNYRDESELKSRVIVARVAAGTRYGCRKELRELADSLTGREGA